VCWRSFGLGHWPAIDWLAKLNAATALARSGSLPENVNYAVKSSFLPGFLLQVAS